MKQPKRGQSLLQWLSELPAPEARWTLTTAVPLCVLVVVWAALMYSTWETWGDLTVDCGREMYVPAALLNGKMLYRDVWYLYGPLAPYLNSLLFRLFGVHLNVLYWAGSLSALGSAVLLYLAGIRLTSWTLSWAAAAVLLLEAFQSRLFCFPLPYSFSSVYGCLIACLFLLLLTYALRSRSSALILAAGTAAAVAFLLKTEFGAACYATLFAILAVRWTQNKLWKATATDFVAIIPGLAVCAVVTGWMVSIHGVSFITQENIMSWPTSYFMKTYGKLWLATTGLRIDRPALVGAFARTAALAAFLIASHFALRRIRSDGQWQFIGAALLVAGLAVLSRLLPEPAESIFRGIFFPKQMVLLVAAAAIPAWLACWRRGFQTRSIEIALVFTFSVAVAFRLLLGMHPYDYSIYYNGPAVLSFIWLESLVIPRHGRSRLFVLYGELLVGSACLLPALVSLIKLAPDRKNLMPLTTERGEIRVSKQVASNYLAAISFMKEEASLGDEVLSVPEDTSLYFLSATSCPTRVFAFTPGTVAPGKMTEEVISEIERKPVRYLLWSNRKFPEYGTAVFGADYNRDLGEYLKRHYRPVRPLTAYKGPEWNAVIWERIPNREAR